ncbi:hypothetical protein [Herbidospora mongoliensis]|uniref:hypothetical protein n=1 Tax=Herbidospora mongoliensis TaxID=688067 RepID=UPI00082EB293|nr:hypothetical protein [Herbidospora mongoliensis]
MAVSGLALVVVVGVHMADDPEKTSRPAVTPVDDDDVPNAKVIDKDQIIDIDTFDQKDNPLWPLIEESRNAN